MQAPNTRGPESGISGQKRHIKGHMSSSDVLITELYR